MRFPRNIREIIKSQLPFKPRGQFWKPQSPHYSHFSEMSLFEVGFTDSGGVTAWKRDAALYEFLIFRNI